MQNILLIEDEENNNLEPNYNRDSEIEAEKKKRTTEYSKLLFKRRWLVLSYYSGKLQVLLVHWEFLKIAVK